MGMVVTLFLMLINTSNTVRSNMPEAADMTAIEKWLSVCTMSVSLVIVEYAIIIFTNSSYKRYTSLYVACIN